MSASPAIRKAAEFLRRETLRYLPLRLANSCLGCAFLARSFEIPPDLKVALHEPGKIRFFGRQRAFLVVTKEEGEERLKERMISILSFGPL
jgi:hypothetical protein